MIDFIWSAVAKAVSEAGWGAVKGVCRLGAQCMDLIFAGANEIQKSRRWSILDRSESSVAAIVAVALILGGCMFREEQHVDAEKYFSNSANVGDNFICVTSPDNNGLLSTAPGDLGSAMSDAAVGDGRGCSPFVSAIPFYFSKDNNNIVFEMNGCKVSRAITLVGGRGQLVQGGVARCGRRSSFKIIEVGKGASEFRIVQAGREWE